MDASAPAVPSRSYVQTTRLPQSAYTSEREGVRQRPWRAARNPSERISSPTPWDVCCSVATIPDDDVRTIGPASAGCSASGDRELTQSCHVLLHRPHLPCLCELDAQPPARHTEQAAAVHPEQVRPARARENAREARPTRGSRAAMPFLVTLTSGTPAVAKLLLEAGRAVRRERRPEVRARGAQVPGPLHGRSESDAGRRRPDRRSTRGAGPADAGAVGERRRDDTPARITT